jgi:hypothetical protein
MFTTRLNLAAMSAVLMVFQGAAVRAGDAEGSSIPLPAQKLVDEFDSLRSLIKPKPGGFDDIPWMTDLWEARKKAAEEGKPLLVWVGDGHPLGWT